MRVLILILCLVVTCYAKYYVASCNKGKRALLVAGVCMIDDWNIVMHDYDTYSSFVRSDGHDESGYHVEVYRCTGLSRDVRCAKSIKIWFPDGSVEEHEIDQDDYCEVNGKFYYSWSNASDEMQAWAYDHCHEWCSTEPN